MKYHRLFFLLLLCEVINWTAYNWHLFKNRIWILFGEQEIYEMYYIMGDYFDVGTYLLVLSVISVIAMEYCLKTETLPALVRSSSRRAFLYKRWMTVAAVSLLYVLIHLALGYGMGRALFADIFSQSEQTARFYAVSTPLLLLFFLRVNVIYLLMRDVFNKKIYAMAGIVGLALFEYFTGYFVFLQVWMPCRDLELSAAAYMGSPSGAELMLTMLRQIGLTAIIAIISLKYFERKDVIEDER